MRKTEKERIQKDREKTTAIHAQKAIRTKSTASDTEANAPWSRTRTYTLSIQLSCTGKIRTQHTTALCM